MIAKVMRWAGDRFKAGRSSFGMRVLLTTGTGSSGSIGQKAPSPLQHEKGLQVDGDSKPKQSLLKPCGELPVFTHEPKASSQTANQFAS